MLRSLAIVLVAGAVLAPGARAASHDGHIYYVERSELVKVTAGGTDRQVVYKPDFAYTDLAFAPGGKILGATAGGNGLHLLDAFDGSHERDIRPRAQWSGRPSWSPGGRELAFSECDRTIFTDVDECVTYGVYRVRRDGTHLRRLATGRGPSWSPDGRSIAFERAMPQRRSTGNRCYGIYTKRLRTGRPHPIRPRRPRCPVNYENPWNVAFSPDGRRVLFIDRYSLWTVRPDGSRARRIVRGRDIVDATWSPDGRLVAYARPDGVYVAGAQGERPHRVVAGQRPSDLAWQPVPSGR